jgi:phosphopantothenoylcysteine decarboxylase
MANVLLGVTGSVAAILTPALFDELKKAGHQVKVVATQAALYFFEAAALAGTNGQRNREVLILDEDEWPGQEQGRHWQRGEPVLHIELRRWADVLVIAPLDANTLAKLALGLCDNCLTCVWRAWDMTRPLVLAPAMNTLMWEHPATGRHLAQLAADCPHLHVLPPVSKRLACDDVGVGAMASVAEVAAAVASVLGWHGRGVQLQAQAKENGI